MDLDKKVEEIRLLNYKLSRIYSEITIEAFFDNYKDSEKPLLIYIQGYTPGFNDGDPCEHTVWRLIGVEVAEALECGADSNLFEEFGLDLDIFENEYLFAEEPEGLSFYIESILEEALRKEYGTDWQILINCYKGKVQYKKSDYYCGY